MDYNSTIITVTEEQLQEYLCTAKRKNPINKLWKNILREMPREYYKVVKKDFTDLAECNCGTVHDKNTKCVYRFKPRNENKDIKEYLHNYLIIKN